MSYLEITATLSTIGASIAVVVTAVFVWKQTRLQSRTLTADERRFRRESAQDVFNKLTAPEFRSARKIMLKALNENRVEPTESAELDAFRLVLNTYEMLGVKVRLDAIEPEAWRVYWRKPLIRDWERLTPFITSERGRFDNPSLFEDAEAMVKLWKGQ